MNKKVFLLVFVFLVFSSFISAIDEPENFYNFNNNYTDATNNNNGTGFSTSFTTGLINEAVDFTGSLDKVTLYDLELQNSMSFNFWMKTNGWDASSERLFAKGNTGVASTSSYQLARYSNTDQLDFFIGCGGSNYNRFRTDSGLTNIADNNWHMITIIINTYDDVEFWFDGSLYADTELIDLCNSYGNTATNLLIGFDEYYTGANDYEGLIDMFGIWLSDISVDINSLYNGGVGVEYPFVNVENFEITAISDYNGNNIDNFSADIGGTIYNTTNGTIITDILDNSTSLYNITIFDSDWYNRSYNNYNVSSNLIAELNQTIIFFNFKFSNGDFVPTPINVTDLNYSLFFNVSGGILNFSPSAEVLTFSVRCDNEVFAPFNITKSFSALQEESFEFIVNETQSILTFLDENTGFGIENATITINYPSGESENLSTNSSGSISFSYIHLNVTEFGTYNFSFSKFGFLPINFSEVINASTIPFSETYNISRANLTINVYNRSDGILLSGVNVTIDFVGLFNETTIVGVIEKTNLTIMQDEYSVFVSASGYRTEKRVFSFSNQESLEIDFYLLSLSDPNAGVLTATASDNFFRKRSSVPIDLLEYKPSSLSYVSVSQCITNANGECDFLVELNTKVYYLRAITSIDGVVYIADSNTDGEIFTSSGGVRNLIFNIDTSYSVEGESRLIYSIDENFIGNTSFISVDFVNSDGTNVEVCVEYFKRVAGSYITVTGDLYCLVSSSAVQNIDVSVNLNRSNNYKAEVYIKKSNGNIPLNSYFYPSINSVGEIWGDIFVGAFIIFLWLILLGYSLHTKNITIFFVGEIILSWLEVIFFPLFGIVAVSVFRTIIGSATIFISRKPKDFE